MTIKNEYYVSNATEFIEKDNFQVLFQKIFKKDFNEKNINELYSKGTSDSEIIDFILSDTQGLFFTEYQELNDNFKIYEFESIES